jgi:preprotein translocase subunit SecA
MHQALEAKERVSIQRETITYATITLQNYFRMFSKLAGMTGTAATEAEEFYKIYKLEVVEIPTNLPMVREDDTDLIYRNQKVKYEAVVKEIGERQKKGQPVLVGTTDISKSELLSEMLSRCGIPHEVLNAKQHEREAAIIAEAGRSHAVTVATNMAGRGTDIVLGGNPDTMGISKEELSSDHDHVVGLGGLHIIGTERHDARRIDNQLRGRAGRQGDPGSSRFFVALDDDLMRRFGGDRIKTVMDWAGLDENAALENKMVSKSLESAQTKVEAYHFDTRKHLVEYDDVVNTHRTVTYAERDKVLGGVDMKANIQSMVDRELREILNRHFNDVPSEKWDVDGLLGELQSIFELPDDLFDSETIAQTDPEEIERRALEHAAFLYEESEAAVTPEVMRTIERQLMLRVIDVNWVPHLTAMENLRQGIGLYAYGQRDPLVMYKKEGREMFDTLLARIQYDIVHTVYHLSVSSTNGDGRAAAAGHKNLSGGQNIMTPVMENRSRGPVATRRRKLGRNEPCYCGSSKKYKRCHGT